jgi:hypothetical protein
MEHLALSELPISYHSVWVLLEDQAIEQQIYLPAFEDSYLNTLAKTTKTSEGSVSKAWLQYQTELSIYDYLCMRI